MMTSPDVLRIIEILDFRAHPKPLKKNRVRHWLESNEPNVIGAAIEGVLRHWEYIEPALTRREVGDLLMKNFDVSLRSRGEERKYRGGDERQRNCLIAGAMEHIFEVEGLREMFGDWKDDAELSYAFTKAEEWRSWVAARVRAVEPVARRAADILRARGYEG